MWVIYRVSEDIPGHVRVAAFSEYASAARAVDALNESYEAAGREVRFFFAYEEV